MPSCTHKSPWRRNGFFFFNLANNPFNQYSIPGTIARNEWAFLLLTDIAADRCYDKPVAPRPLMSQEQSKKQELIKEITKAEQDIQELTEDELKGVSGGIRGGRVKDLPGVRYEKDQEG